MRREHNIQSNPLLDFLQAHDCIFFSPLSQNDTSDWISGNAMTLYSSNSAVWDAVNGIWKFQHVSGQPYNNSMYAARWQCQIPSISPAEFTGIAELYAYNVSDANSCYDVLPTRQGLSLYGTQGTLTQSAQVLGTENNRTVQRQYRDGIVVFSYNYSAIVSVPAITHIRIGTFYNNYQAQVQGPYGLRNFAFFLKELTLSEINEYFNMI